MLTKFWIQTNDIEIVGDDTEGSDNGKRVVLKTSTRPNLFSSKKGLIDTN